MNIKYFRHIWSSILAFALFLSLPVNVYTQQSPFPTFDDKIVQVFATRHDDSVSYGAGFIVTPAGTFLTAAHIIADTKTGQLYENFRARVTVGDSLKILPVTLVYNFLIDTPSYDLALFQVDYEAKVFPLFPFFIIGDKPKKGSQVIIAGYPKIFKQVPTRPVYRSGIVATHYLVKNAPVTILDLPSAKGFSGSGVIDITRKEAAVFAVVRGFAADETEDLTVAYDIPARIVQARLKTYNEEKKKKE